MWKSWFIDNDLTWLGLPAMVIFMVAFVVASVRAFRAPAPELAAAAARPLNDETLMALSKDEAAVARGKVTFTAICAACHLQNGEGLVGPNLTDNAWIHGGKPMAMHLVISEGVIAKGMPSWKATLGDAGTKDVIAYVLTLKGKNLPGKAPEGTVE